MAESPASEISLAGLVDMHVHSGPDVRPRRLDDIAVAREAAAAGLRAVLIKSHVTITADRAAIAESLVPGVRVLGGIALNHQVGGLNVAAVETALALGAKEVWLPTFSARGNAGLAGGIAVVDEVGDLLPVVRDIMRLVAERDVILGTGHLSVPEIVLVVREARQLGLRKVLVTHPDNRMIEMPAGTQRELAGLGAYFERTYESVLTHPTLDLAGLAARIRTVGLHSTVLTSDFGQPENPAPVAGFRECIAGLLAAGITLDEVRLMAGENPSRLLDL
jgi:hypothetical protein